MREKAQLDVRRKRMRADLILNNDGGIHTLRTDTHVMLSTLLGTTEAVKRTVEKVSGIFSGPPNTLLYFLHKEILRSINHLMNQF